MTAYVRKVHCAVVGTASDSVQGQPGTRDSVAIRRARKTRTDWPPCTEHQRMLRSQRFTKEVVTFRKYLTGKGYRPPNSVGVRKPE